jgi:hypothetical protein
MVRYRKPTPSDLEALTSDKTFAKATYPSRAVCEYRRMPEEPYVGIEYFKLFIDQVKDLDTFYIIYTITDMVTAIHPLPRTEIIDRIKLVPPSVVLPIWVLDLMDASVTRRFLESNNITSVREFFNKHGGKHIEHVFAVLGMKAWYKRSLLLYTPELFELLFPQIASVCQFQYDQRYETIHSKPYTLACIALEAWLVTDIAPETV